MKLKLLKFFNSEELQYELKGIQNVMNSVPMSPQSKEVYISDILFYTSTLVHSALYKIYMRGKKVQNVSLPKY